jgi:hypothetical protein
LRPTFAERQASALSSEVSDSTVLPFSLLDPIHKDFAKSVTLRLY